MHKATLREIAKFLAGLILGDFLAGWWLLSSGIVPTSFLGLKITSQGIMAGMAFDVILLAFLIHYGWRIKSSGHSSAERTFHRLAGTIFGIIAIAHLLRLIFNLPVSVLTWNAPYWVSGIATVAAAFLSYASFTLTKKDKKTK